MGAGVQSPDGAASALRKSGVGSRTYTTDRLTAKPTLEELVRIHEMNHSEQLVMDAFNRFCQPLSLIWVRECKRSQIGVLA